MMDKTTKILVCDDMSTMRRIIISQLKDLGFSNVIEVGNGQKAWDTLTQSIGSEDPIGLVFCDWNMPILDGLELLRKVRADSNFEELPFVMLTAKAEDIDVEEANENHVSGYITKPVSKNDLQETIERIAG